MQIIPHIVSDVMITIISHWKYIIIYNLQCLSKFPIFSFRVPFVKDKKVIGGGINRICSDVLKKR